jgi:AraC-like DNA-binding protein
MMPLRRGPYWSAYAQQGNRAEPVEVWKTRRFIEEHSAEELSLSKVAKVVNISPNYLSEKFKHVTGVNFVDYIARTRFEKARNLLQNTNLRISEIAFAVGFQSLSQFNRVFKKLSGKSPTEFRARFLKRSEARRIGKSPLINAQIFSVKMRSRPGAPSAINLATCERNSRSPKPKKRAAN